MMMMRLALVVIAVSSTMTMRAEGVCLFRKTYVYLVSDLPASSPPLSYLCKSNDDNFGWKNLSAGATFSFDFCPVPYITFFHCIFNWNGKSAEFDVYHANVFKTLCANKRCYYSIRPQGFWLSYRFPPKALTRVVAW